MKLRNLFMIACLIGTSSLFAQEVDKATVTAQAAAAETAVGDLQKVDTGEKAWKCTGIVGLNASATGLVNWAAGGNNNITGVVFGKVRLLYHKGSFAWDSNLDMEYGLSYIDQNGDKLQKSSDHINFNTKLGWEFHKNWYATFLAGFQSQFDLGRNYAGLGDMNEIISKWLAPSYTDISIGIDWKPNNIFSLYLSPVAGRITTAYVSDKMNEKYMELYPMDMDSEGNMVGGLRQVLQESYGVWKYDENGNKAYANARAELGLNFKGAINYEYKGMKIITAVGLYTPYAWDKTVMGQNENGKDIYRDNNRRFGNFDVDWDFAISYQFAKCLNVTLSTSLKYYNGVMIDKTYKDSNDGHEFTLSAERVQFKSVLGLGVSYSF